MEPIKVLQVKNKSLKIFADDSSDDPRNWDNLTTMVFSHKNYNLGDKHDYNFNDYSSWNEVEQAIRKKEDVVVMMPVYMYEHSNIAISTTPFNDVFDSGRLGVVYITKDAIRNTFGVKRVTKKLIERAKNHVKGEVETYNQYISGDVYRFEVVKVTTCDKGHKHEEVLDSCGGFFGSDFKDNGMKDYVNDEELVAELEKS